MVSEEEGTKNVHLDVGVAGVEEDEMYLEQDQKLISFDDRLE